MKYFYNGARITERNARDNFFSNWRMKGMSDEDIEQYWSDCQHEEDSRDIFMPDGLEMMQD